MTRSTGGLVHEWDVYGLDLTLKGRFRERILAEDGFGLVVRSQRSTLEALTRQVEARLAKMVNQPVDDRFLDWAHRMAQVTRRVPCWLRDVGQVQCMRATWTPQAHNGIVVGLCATISIESKMYTRGFWG